MNEAVRRFGALAKNAVRTIPVWFNILIRSRHAVLVAILGGVFLTLVDSRCILKDDDDSISWWFMHVILFGFFYLFLQPWVRSLSRPWTGASNYINEWLASWLALATAYHLPSSQSDGVSMFWVTLAVSILLLLVIHSIFEGCLYFLAADSRKWPDKWTILKILGDTLMLSTGVSAVCCIFIRHCKKRTPTGGDIQTKRTIVPSGKENGLVRFELLTLEEGHGGEARGPFGRRRPQFKDMVPWHSGTSTDLYKTVFDLLVSKTVFGGRFDMRVLQFEGSFVAMNGGQRRPINGGQDDAEQEETSNHFSKKSELWFDFMADTGDGGNSTYTVAKLLAQPSISCPGPFISGSRKNLPRGELLIIGEDLAYPHPSQEIYKERLFDPFHYALQEPSSQGKANKPSNDTPRCFLIPGNHDWVDGLDTFIGNICHGSWLGGWFMPQQKSYFALKLPKGWWVLGLDCALREDIDVYQLKYFSRVAKTEVGEHDSVIVLTHQPDWFLNRYEKGEPKKNISELIRDVLKEKCKLRIAGDIHHYMRHSIVKSDESAPPHKHLLVNGCGGAFTHPTHVFEDFKKFDEEPCKLGKEYPSFQTSRRVIFSTFLPYQCRPYFQGIFFLLFGYKSFSLGAARITQYLELPKENGQFDYVGGILYFILVFSMFPRCELEHMFQGSIFVSLRRFPCTLWDAFIYMLAKSYVSLGGAVLLLALAIAFAPSKLPRWRRIVLGILHVFAHLTVALILMLLLELGTEMLVREGLLKTSGCQSLYLRHLSRETNCSADSFPNYFLFAFDVPEFMALKRSNICTNGWASISRKDALLYRISVFLCFWVLSTPFVSIVFGNYLYICVGFFNLHYDEAFSSLRISNYKAFTRFHIKHNGDLEVFTLAVDKVPEDWTEDDDWKNEPGVQDKMSHKRQSPSRWKAAPPYQDPVEAVKIIDQFTISGGRPSSNPVLNIVFGLSICATVVGNVLRRRSR